MRYLICFEQTERILCFIGEFTTTSEQEYEIIYNEWGFEVAKEKVQKRNNHEHLFPLFFGTGFCTTEGRLNALA